MISVVMCLMTHRDEFLRLYPSDVQCHSDELLLSDPLIARRCGSTDMLDENKMKTLYLDYPDAGRRYKLHFDVAGFDVSSIRVSTDDSRLVVRASRCDEQRRVYCRKIQTPRDIDYTKFECYLTVDSVLVIEAPAPYCSHSHNIRKVCDIATVNDCLAVSPRTVES